MKEMTPMTGLLKAHSSKFWLLVAVVTVAVIVIVVICALVLPRAWKRFEVFQPGPDYRIPYALSKDYWLYERRLDLAARPDRVMVVGDSVVWGEYVRPDGTLTHFLNQHAAQSDRFDQLRRQRPLPTRARRASSRLCIGPARPKNPAPLQHAVDHQP